MYIKFINVCKNFVRPYTNLLTGKFIKYKNNLKKKIIFTYKIRMNILNMFAPMKINNSKSDSDSESESEPDSESDYVIDTSCTTNIPIVISILHDEVSSIFRTAGIGETSINSKTVERIKKIIYKTKNRDIDLLINTSGGNLGSTKQICETFLIYKKKYPNNKIRAYIQDKALSGGTFIALCADELYMSDYCHLSLTEPYICDLYLSDITSVIDIKNTKAWDFFYILKKKSERALKLCTHLLTKILESNSKYLNSKQNIIKSLLNDEFEHSDGLTIDDCELIGIVRNGDIPERINKLFDSEYLIANPKKTGFVDLLTTSLK